MLLNSKASYICDPFSVTASCKCLVPQPPASLHGGSDPGLCPGHCLHRPIRGLPVHPERLQFNARRSHRGVRECATAESFLPSTGPMYRALMLLHAFTVCDINSLLPAPCHVCPQAACEHLQLYHRPCCPHLLLPSRPVRRGATAAWQGCGPRQANQGLRTRRQPVENGVENGGSARPGPLALAVGQGEGPYGMPGEK